MRRCWDRKNSCMRNYIKVKLCYLHRHHLNLQKRKINSKKVEPQDSQLASLGRMKMSANISSNHPGQATCSHIRQTIDLRGYRARMSLFSPENPNNVSKGLLVLLGATTFSPQVVHLRTEMQTGEVHTWAGLHIRLVPATIQDITMVPTNVVLDKEAWAHQVQIFLWRLLSPTTNLPVSFLIQVSEVRQIIPPAPIEDNKIFLATKIKKESVDLLLYHLFFLQHQAH